MATSRRVGNYAQAGRAVAKSSEQIFDAAMAAKPDFTAIAKEAIKGRSAERQAARRAEGLIARAGIEGKAKVKGYKIASDAKKDVENIKRPARRMAGILGGLGTIATTGAMYVQNKRDKAEEAQERAASDARFKAQEDKWLEMLKTRNSGDDDSEIEPYVPGEPPPMPKLGGSNSEEDDTGNFSQGGGNSSSVKPMSISESSDSGISREGVYNYLTTHHKLSHNKAYGLMANIDRESSFRTVAPGDQGLSNGLFQWHKGRLTNMQKNVPNWQTNWKGQIDYALSEPGEASGQTYLNTTFETPQQAAEFWTRKWERPANPDHDVLKNNKFISTYNFGQV